MSSRDGRLIAIPEDEWRALLGFAQEHHTNASNIIRDAVRAILVAHNRLPPQPPPLDITAAFRSQAEARPEPRKAAARAPEPVRAKRRKA